MVGLIMGHTKNVFAQKLGQRGGLKNTPAQQAARAENAKRARARWGLMTPEQRKRSESVIVKSDS